MSNDYNTYKPCELEPWIVKAVEDYVGDYQYLDDDKLEMDLFYDIYLYGIDRKEKTIRYILLLN
jgi:hypothetical protein